MDNNFLNTIKELYLKTGKPGFIVLQAYDLLVKNGEIEPDEYLEESIIDETLKRMHHEASKKGTIGLKELAHIRQLPSFESLLITECKKQAVANYFTLQYNLDNF